MEDSLVGTWKLISYSLVDENGVETKPWGTDVQGLLIYSADGFMSANLMHNGRKSFAASDLRLGTTEEKASAADGYIAYAGPYTSERGSVTHHVQVSLFPNWVGLTQVRSYFREGDKLILRTPNMPVGGKQVVATLEWRAAAS
jgi:hypothetical protein